MKSAQIRGVFWKNFFRLKIDVIRPNILQRNHEIAELAMCTLQYDESNLFFMWHAIKHNVTSVWHAFWHCEQNSGAPFAPLPRLNRST